jgi:ribosome maturation factor RimP
MNTDPKHIIESKVQELLASSPDLFLVSIKIDAKNNIKVFLDGDTGIAIGQCAVVNRQLYKFLEEEANLFPNNDFSLEVSSAGIDEPLVWVRQYIKNISRSVEVLYKDGTKIEGVLVAANEETIMVQVTTGKGKKMETKVETIAHTAIKSTIVQVKF